MLIGRAALVDFFTAFTCSLAILMGLALTIVLIERLEAKALPALPASIFFGLIFYVATSRVLVPFCHDIVSRQAFF